MADFYNDLVAQRTTQLDEKKPESAEDAQSFHQMRGFTKVQALLAGFENDSDFIVTARNPAQSISGTTY